MLYQALAKFSNNNDKEDTKIGRLNTVATQKNANYSLPLDTDADVEHGFVENFCQLFKLRERLRNIRLEIAEKGYSSTYNYMMGNIVFNSSVFWKSSFFEKLFKPVVDNLNESDKKHGSRFIIMSLKAQINSLKMVMNKEYLIFINITLYKEVISKFISPSVSQYVIVALTRAGIVQTSKYLLERIIEKREFGWKQHENNLRMKRFLDEKVSG